MELLGTTQAVVEVRGIISRLNLCLPDVAQASIRILPLEFFCSFQSPTALLLLQLSNVCTTKLYLKSSH